MKATLQTINPQMAGEMLKKNTRNRPLNVFHVKRLAREMEMGRWKVNGDTIRFNGDIMIDGQHRCAASVQSGCSFQSLIVEGLKSDVFSTIDAGKNRNGSDTLGLLGAVNTNTLAASLKFVERIVTGNVCANGRTAYTNSEVEELYAKYPNMDQSVALVKNRGKSICPLSILGGLHYLFAMRDKEAADKFVEDVQSGINLAEGDGVYRLRERLVQNSFMKQKLRSEFIAALAIKAWNNRRAGKKVSVLRFLDSESFPLIAD
jgi:hypothetical protein